MGARSGGGGGGVGGGSRALSAALNVHEKAIRANNYETLIVFDKNGNILVNKIGGAHSVSYGMDGSKTTDAIVTHNHPSGASFSHQDIAGMVYHNQKEMRATGKEYTFSIRRPEKGWGVSWKSAQARFQRAFENARLTFSVYRTGNAAKDRKLWIDLTNKYNAKAAKDLGWIYTAKKNK